MADNHSSPKTALEYQEGGSHYKNMAIQPVQYILANGLPFAEGCVVKYISRWRSKGGISDLKKARHFLDILIEHEENADCRSTRDDDTPLYTSEQMRAHPAATVAAVAAEREALSAEIECIIGEWAALSQADGQAEREIERLRAEVERMKAQAGEPVAWHVLDEHGGLMHAAMWESAAHEHINDAINEHGLDDAAQWVVRPVYAAPQPPAALAKPLTAEQISEMAVQEEFLLICDGLEALTEIVRATERAHGIGQEGGAA